MSYEMIKVDVRAGIGFLTWSRPRVHNAISPEMMAETMAALSELGVRDDVRVIILSGEGKSFSSGCDISVRADRETQGIDEWRTRYQKSLQFMLSFWRCPKPIIASIHGYCLAGGFEASLACDISVAAESARFGMPEAKMGSPSIMLMLPWLAGPKMSKEILMCAEDTFSAARAKEAGIVNHVVPDEERESFVLELANHIVGASPVAVAYFKRAINQTFEIMGLMPALEANVEAAASMKGIVDKDRDEFLLVRKEQGLKAAIAWRAARVGAQ
ncbi:enoyl-CoA hydratase/isomerase family protein [Aminobacter sp. LjRoot7]|uniref:enoyl-CoA hydratase/isomerase family protein n=1 Tax=Aminobacter sp. LjRoot7 TaxID=3342335 RepID=UPI003ECD738E